MIVGMDLDGCNQLFGPHFYAGLPKIGIANAAFVQDFDAYDFYLRWGKDYSWFTDACHRMVDAGHLYKHMEPIAGSVEAWQRIVDAGHTIEVITARVFGAPGKAEESTRFMLEAAGYPFHGLTVCRDKTVIPTDMFYEDTIPNYDDLEASGSEPWLANQPWNRVLGGDDRRRVDSVGEFADKVLSKG